MANSIWGKGRVYHLVAADTPRGATIFADYSGLHRYAAAAESGVSFAATGAKAQQQAGNWAREALNEGVYFSGFLARKKCGHVDLLIGKHETLGVVALVDISTSHSGNRVEVLFQNVAAKKLLSRSDFFDNLQDEPLTDDVVAQVCQDYHRRFILLKPGVAGIL